jgi:glycosyltransferase involved in cell wall biosynthesis
MKLLIVIPALNEEDSIQGIIERCIAAKDEIKTYSPVTEVDITVVSDGSTDRTVERARQFGERIKLIVFPKNQGYGAAIKEAWRQSDADLLGFLDADGTCEPRFFAQLCSTIVREEAEMVLGSRLNKDSRMTWVRRFGNRLFSTLLSLLSSSHVSDTASGMRVVRRGSLWTLLPLPDGLHFTPAMSARAVLGNLRIREIDMPYHEREGESKLRLGKDGVRFLKAILEASFLYRPARPLIILSLVSFSCACLLMATPVIYYLRHQAVQEWMIYRFVVSHLAGIIAFLFLSASYLSARVVQIALAEKRKMGWRFQAVSRFVRSPGFWLVPLGLITVGGLLVLPSFLELVHTGATFEHWSRFIAMSFFWSIAIILVGTRFVDYVLMLLEAQVIYLRETQPVGREER